ncbi:MAG TPA: NCS1 family nucleobase:cation symporter-1 [Gemmatimonadota bacterium]|jgi:cytosine/uracil/thiamine/allantoin permease|nr:NCS1 family nucleobase:cation symporter-1 [Gemmatimonadota bacterium]
MAVGGPDRAQLLESPYANEDLVPTTPEERRWSRWNIAALWIGMAVCIPTYMLASGLIASGMSWWQALATIALGNVIVLVPMLLNGHAGTKYGVPFPVLLRSSFGVRGANLPALLRAMVACGWFGIQTWIGGHAIYALARVPFPAMGEAPVIAGLGINGWELACFVVFWAMNLYFAWAGTDSIKWLEAWGAPILLAMGLALLGWAMTTPGGLGRALSFSDQFGRPSLAVREGTVRLAPLSDEGAPRATEYRFGTGTTEPEALAALSAAAWSPFTPEPIAIPPAGPATEGPIVVAAEVRDAAGAVSPALIARGGGDDGGRRFWLLFIPGLTAMVGFWATLSLNIPDFTRLARSQSDQAWGQILGLPPTMVLFAFIGIAATCAAALRFRDVLVVEAAPWDPVALLARFDSPLLIVVSMIAIIIATLTTNIAANVVSPAFDFSNIAPRWISFRTGGVLTAVIGLLIMPWKLIMSTQGYIFTWLIGYGALLGPVAGIMIADYWVVRRTYLHTPSLYQRNGSYWYRGGWRWGTVAILIAAVVPNVPGFLAAAGFVAPEAVPPLFHTLYTYAWFVGFGIALVAYSLWAGRTRDTITAAELHAA